MGLGGNYNKANTESVVEKLTNEERREVELEASVMALYEIIEVMDSKIPMDVFGHLPNMAMQILNNAGIRADIKDWATLEIEYED